MHLFSLFNLEGTTCYGAVCALSRAQYTGKGGAKTSSQHQDPLAEL